MTDLFAPPTLTRDTFASRKLSIVPVRGDRMSPTLRGDWDYVLAAPVDGFLYDGLYVVEVLGQPCIYRCQHMGSGQIRMSGDNPLYPADRLVPHDAFTAMVLGIVVCDLKVRDPRLMQGAWGTGR